jgi:hypothetical protein
MEERKVLAPRLEGDSLRQDIARVSVSFSGHRLIAPGADEAQTRLEVGRRIIERLAQLALARVASLGEKAAGTRPFSRRGCGCSSSGAAG